MVRGDLPDKVSLDTRSSATPVRSRWVAGRNSGREATSVNRLVDSLLAHPEAIDQVAGEEEVSFDLLAGILGDHLLGGPEWEWESKPGVAELRRPLSVGYLPTISASEWDRAFRDAEDGLAGAPGGWWTVMVPGTARDVGLTVPQDSSRADNVALFTGRPARDAQVLAYDRSRRSPVDLSRGSHCSSTEPRHMRTWPLRRVSGAQGVGSANRQRHRLSLPGPTGLAMAAGPSVTDWISAVSAATIGILGSSITVWQWRRTRFRPQLTARVDARREAIELRSSIPAGPQESSTRSMWYGPTTKSLPPSMRVSAAAPFGP